MSKELLSRKSNAKLGPPHVLKLSTSQTEDLAPAQDGDPLPPLIPSPLRPEKCAIPDHLRRWLPKNPRNTLDANGRPTNLAQQDLDRIKVVLEDAFAPTTRATYGTGLGAFHDYCDLRNISEDHRAPIDPTVLSCFIAHCIGTYGGSTIRNYVYGIRAWHIVHGMRWELIPNELEALFKAGNKLSPKESRKKEKKPWTKEILTIICKSLKLDDPKDAAILTCLTTAFWGTARLGEVTIPNLKSFKPETHVKVSDVRHDVLDRNSLKQTVIFIPWTKVAREKGEDIFWAEQDGDVDPKNALTNHLKINNPPKESHLFAFKHENTMRPMTRNIFLTRINKIIKENKLEGLQGHGIRVGSTLEYLLRGIPFDVVKAKGRWQSDAFRGYLRKHAEIMGPYIQKEHVPYDTVIRYSMPPVR